jgi:hypothetical protein
MTAKEKAVIDTAMAWWFVRTKTTGPTLEAAVALKEACEALSKERES